jgi:Arc/MetJ-type ribon-helix-helix transcriptional regulator
MLNYRSPGQKLLPVPVTEEFLQKLNAGVRQAGYTNRSQFVRDAIVEKLARAGVSIPTELSVPPHRHGKSQSAPVKGRYPIHRPSGYALNEKAEKKPGRKSDSK